MKEFLAGHKEIVLGLLVVLLSAAVWHTFFTGAGGGAASGAGMPGRVARPDLATLRLYAVDWAALDSPRPSYDQNGRNIFQFGVIPPPAPPPLTAAEKAAILKAQQMAEEERKRQAELFAQQEEERRIQEEAERQRIASLPPPPPPLPPKPQPPAINYKFIGYIGPPDRKVAILHDGTDLVFVREGEVLPPGIKVLEVGYESIKFGFTDPQFKDESRTLPMSSSY